MAPYKGAPTLGPTAPAIFNTCDRPRPICTLSSPSSHGLLPNSIPQPQSKIQILCTNHLHNTAFWCT